MSDNQMILCGTCMYLDTCKCCIKGMSCACINVYQGGVNVGRTECDAYGNYYLVVPRSACTMISACKGEKEQCINVETNNSNFCMKHFIF